MFRILQLKNIVYLILFGILVYLGTWQLGRYIEKKELYLQMQQQVNAFPQRLSTITAPNLTMHRFTPVIVYGTYLNKYTFLLDNQMFNHKPGYRVLTIMQSPYVSKWILIDRGWIARGKTAQELPIIQDDYGVQEIVGIINTIPIGFTLSGDNLIKSISWPLLIQTLDYEFINKILQHQVFDFIVQLPAGNPSAYIVPPINFGIPSDKHLAYALQWYFFALMLLAFYLITSVRRV